MQQAQSFSVWFETNRAAFDRLGSYAVLNTVAGKLRSCVYKREPIKPSIVQELLDFGVLKVSDLDELFTDKLVSAIDRQIKSRNSRGLIRLAMFWHDLEKYFSKAWKKDWKLMTDETYGLLTSRYGEEKLDKILEGHSIKLLSSAKKSPAKK